jgi:demethylmenaquinone methyltransferase/2-methoxy-6-polyprenyl-1,4-benzoquinol methylase
MPIPNQAPPTTATPETGGGDGHLPLAPHAPIGAYYDGESQRRGFVSRAFDAAAGDYERIERWMALGSGAWYRRRAVVRAGLRPGMRVLDVAAGTGLVTRAAADVVGGAGLVIGVDPSDGMLRQAAGHADGATAVNGSGGATRATVQFVRGVAERLPFEDGRFDFLSMGYALRHVADLPTAFREFRRVLRPGGVVCVLEITRPRGRLATALMRWYMRGLIPRLSRLTGGRASRAGDSQTLWQYYWDTIEACVAPQQVLDAMAAAGFTRCGRHVELGVFSEYTGEA